MDPNESRGCGTALEHMATKELGELFSAVSEVLERRRLERKANALHQIIDIAREHELTYDEVVAAVRTTARRKKAPPVYRNPENPRQTWSGKGAPPRWFSDHPEPESLRIPGTDCR